MCMMLHAPMCSENRIVLVLLLTYTLPIQHLPLHPHRPHSSSTTCTPSSSTAHHHRTTTRTRRTNGPLHHAGHARSRALATKAIREKAAPASGPLHGPRAPATAVDGAPTSSGAPCADGICPGPAATAGPAAGGGTQGVGGGGGGGCGRG